MSEEMLKVVGATAGAVGILTALVITVFRTIITKNIFPRLTKVQAYRVLLSIILLSFLIGTWGIYAWLREKESGLLQTETIFTIYLDSIPLKFVSVEIPENNFESYTNSLGEIRIPAREPLHSLTFLVDGKYSVKETLPANGATKNIYLHSQEFMTSEIGGVVLMNGRPEYDVRIVTEHGDSTRSNHDGHFRFHIRYKTNQTMINVIYSKGPHVKRAVVPVDQGSLALEL